MDDAVPLVARWVDAPITQQATQLTVIHVQRRLIINQPRQHRIHFLPGFAPYRFLLFESTAHNKAPFIFSILGDYCAHKYLQNVNNNLLKSTTYN